jgi:hypothetical protein
MMRFPSDEARKEAREKISRAARGMIEAQDYLALQRLYMRLASRPTFDMAVFDALITAAEKADDASILHAVEYVRAVEALAGCGRTSRG